MSEYSVLWVGPIEPGFPGNGSLGIECEQFHVVRDAQEAAEFVVRGGSPPDLVVVVQSRPGQFTADAMARLRALAPLASIWRQLGSWCEGEARSGRPPVGCANNYWHQWPARWAQETARAQDGHCPAWGLPATATPEERALAIAEQPLPRGSGIVVIHSRRAQNAAALADACQLVGYDTRVVGPHSPLTPTAALATLWDASIDELTDPAMFRNLSRLTADAPVLGLMSFPRADDCQRAAKAGLWGLISKPFLLHDLFWHLQQVAKASAV